MKSGFKDRLSQLGFVFPEDEREGREREERGEKNPLGSRLFENIISLILGSNPTCQQSWI